MGGNGAERHGSRSQTYVSVPKHGGQTEQSRDFETMPGFMESRPSMTRMKDAKIGLENASLCNNHEINIKLPSSIIINPWSCGHRQLKSVSRVVY